MKSLFLSFIAIVFILTGCKKDHSDNDNNFYIRHKIDGVVKEYKYDVLATKNKIGNEYYFVLSGRRKVNTNQTLIVDFADPQPIEAKTYQQNGNYEYVIAYVDDNLDFYTAQDVTDPGIKVTISKITSTTVSGTFSGKVSEDVSGKEVLITDGEFHAKLK
jgi:hypothetical protein